MKNYRFFGKTWTVLPNMILLVILALTLIADVACVLKERQKKTSETDLTRGWKTYANRKYNYSMRYPTNWYIRQNNPNTPGIAIKHAIQHTDFAPSKNYDYYKSENFFISVVVWDNPLKLYVRDWLKNENINHPALLVGQTTTVHGKEAIKYEPKGNAYYIEVWFTNNDKAYQLFYCESSKKQEHLAIFNQMLSTFSLKEME